MQLPTQDEISAWYKDMPDTFKRYIQKLKQDARNATLQEVEDEIEATQKLKRILIPLAVFAFPAGLIAQRFLNLLG